MTVDPYDPWSKTTRDYWFYGFLAASSISIVYLFSPFLFVLLFAAVTVVVTWPLYVYLLQRCGGRSFVAACLALMILGFSVFMPFLFVGQLFAIEALEVVGRWAAYLSSGGFEQTIADLEVMVESYQTPRVQEFISDVVPEDFNVLTTILGPLKRTQLS